MTDLTVSEARARLADVVDEADRAGTPRAGVATSTLGAGPSTRSRAVVDGGRTWEQVRASDCELASR